MQADAVTPAVQSPIRLDPPNGVGDGILIQINDGAIVAEPVAVSEGMEHAQRLGGQKLVVDGTGASVEDTEEVTGNGSADATKTDRVPKQ